MGMFVPVRRRMSYKRKILKALAECERREHGLGMKRQFDLGELGLYTLKDYQMTAVRRK